MATDATSPQVLYDPLVEILVELSAFLYDLDHGLVPAQDPTSLMARARSALAALEPRVPVSSTRHQGVS